MLIFSGSSQNPGSSVLDELQLSNGLLWKTGEETITIIHPAGDKGMNKFLQILTGNKTSNSCNVFEMIVCWFSYCFDKTTKAKVCLQNHPKISDLIFSRLTPRVKVCIHLENFIHTEHWEEKRREQRALSLSLPQSLRFAGFFSFRFVFYFGL